MRPCASNVFSLFRRMAGAVLWLALAGQGSWAGELIPPGAPMAPTGMMYRLDDLASRLAVGTNAPLAAQGFVPPASAPADEGTDLNQLMSLAPAPSVSAAQPEEVLAGRIYWSLATPGWGTQTGQVPTQALSPTSTLVVAGYYTATNLSQVDPNLASGNIAVGRVIFGIPGSAATNPAYPVVLQRTGQSESYRPGDDGDLQKGAPWAVPRFVEHGNGTLTDQNTGLMWLQDANAAGALIWNDAVDFCNALDAGGDHDWRLPNIHELQTLVDRGQADPALPSGHPFSNLVVSAYYWTSTTYEMNTDEAWALYVGDGDDRNRSKMSTLYVWPVRGGPQ